ncbi:GNAT family N-acetyltransferase [Cellulosimicrobium cellulans]|uniref:GNAT family N-acetyltransferase n=1 Tax=Cellulosimicrobium cellulans TaxID=1710 RepID=UPI001BA80F42|nr:GNAT family N-acetyltransferase [Cellulosimicrobium cellulans]QUB99116.1 GNAT family N-acetyltransferase [Cellulosimicrobium cellulans]
MNVDARSELSLRRVTALNVEEVCDLSDTLTAEQQEMVADNARSLAVGFCSGSAWFRAVYAGETPVGFVMTHTGYDWDDDIECPGVYLWRLMVARPYQGMGFGRRVVELVARDVLASGRTELFTSFGEGAGSPEAFYDRLGFVRTGDSYGDEPEVVLDVRRFLAVVDAAG